MNVSNMAQARNGWVRFNLSVGGFVIKNCRWRPQSGRIFFPQRYDTRGQQHRVVYAHGALVKRLRNLLESDRAETPRDRRPCILRIHGFGESYAQRHRWLIFSFTVRGFTILGCRWEPQSGSIQLPVTYVGFDEHRHCLRKKAVVCAYGAHIDRLRGYLEAHLQWEPHPAAAEEADGVLAE
jgi:hypothetical protein